MAEMAPASKFPCESRSINANKMTKAVSLGMMPSNMPNVVPIANWRVVSTPRRVDRAETSSCLSPLIILDPKRIVPVAGPSRTSKLAPCQIIGFLRAYSGTKIACRCSFSTVCASNPLAI